MTSMAFAQGGVPVVFVGVGVGVSVAVFVGPVLIGPEEVGVGVSVGPPVGVSVGPPVGVSVGVSIVVTASRRGRRQDDGVGVGGGRSPRVAENDVSQ